MTTTALPRRRARLRQVPLARLLRRLGPGFITGAADDDPSGIATYAQVGAAFGYTLGWSVMLTTPLMAAVQEISGRIGRVTGAGLAAALCRLMPLAAVTPIIGLLVVANVINLGADIGAMAACLKLLAGGSEPLYALVFAGVCAGAEIWLAYKRYVLVLKWLTLSLFAYVALLFVVRVPVGEVLSGLFIPRLRWDRAMLVAVLGLLGTTISPYLFFWQASQEAEDEAGEADPRPLRQHPADAPREMWRIEGDTYFGMAFSNLIAVAIIVGTAATLHAHGATGVDSAQAAAAALRPVAGPFAGAVFAAGVIGTGLLAVPVLAGSAAYAVGEALHWRVGLRRRATEARSFYVVIALATLVGAGVVFSPISPMKALFWSAVVNGVVAPPLIAAMTLAASSRKVMGELVIPPWLQTLGWGAAAVMALAAAGALLAG